MPALNFKKRFRSDIESGAKGHSIRGKRSRPWKVGDKLALYTGMRTKFCSLIFRTVVTKVQDIAITVIPDSDYARIEIDGETLSPDEMEAFAKSDGFVSHADMMAFWRENNTLPFVGDVIHWKFPEEVLCG